MRTIEKLGMAFRKLLEISEKSPVTVTFRGVDDHNRKLYEVKNRRGEVIASQETDSQLAGRLVADIMEKEETGEKIKAEMTQTEF